MSNGALFDTNEQMFAGGAKFNGTLILFRQLDALHQSAPLTAISSPPTGDRANEPGGN
jgi:hypothetical protein